MSKSLQDQLRDLGLARDRPRSKPGRQKGRKRARSVGESAASAARKTGEVSLEEAFRLREQAEKKEASDAKRRKQAEDRRRRELNRTIKAIVEPNRLNDPAAEESRYFLYKGRIRKVHVTADQLEALNEGRLGLVYLAGGYHVLEPEHVAAVRRISAEHVPDLAGEGDAGEEAKPS